MKRFSLSLGQLLLVSAVVWAAPGAKFEAHKLTPVDEATQKPDLVAARDALKDAVKKKDVEALLKLVDPNIKCGSGGKDGIASFKTRWHLDANAAESPLWQVLGRVLDLGGTFEGDQFVAPYVFAKWPESHNSFEFGAITGDKVNVRSKPAKEAPAVKQLNYDIVRFVFDSFEKPATLTIDGETWPWVKVGLANGSEGYVWGKFFQSPLGYRAGFQQTNAEWKLTSFVSGD